MLQLVPTRVATASSSLSVSRLLSATDHVFSAAVLARLDDSSAWTQLYSVVNQTAVFPCFDSPATSPPCDTLTLLDSSMGVTGFTSYAFSVQWVDADVVAGLSAAGYNATYGVGYQRGVFRVGDIAVRLALSAITLVVLAWWLYALTWQPQLTVTFKPLPSDVGKGSGTPAAGSSAAAWTPGLVVSIRRTRHVPPTHWLAQQILIALLLVAVLLWQDPMTSSISLIIPSLVAEDVGTAQAGGDAAGSSASSGGEWSPGSPTSRLFTLLSVVWEYVGRGALLTFWWLLVGEPKLINRGCGI